MGIVRWRPFDLVSPGFWEPRLKGWRDMLEDFEALDLFGWPRMDVYSEGPDLVVKMELPGMQAQDIDISLDKNALAISGKHVRNEEVEEADYYRKERFYGSFSRTIPLPKEVKDEDVKAAMKDGVLTVRVKEAGAAVPGKKMIPIEEG